MFVLRFEMFFYSANPITTWALTVLRRPMTSLSPGLNARMGKLPVGVAEVYNYQEVLLLLKFLVFWEHVASLL